MRTRAFAIRNSKEMLRDPLNLAFGIGFPVIILLLLSVIQSSIPENGPVMFEINNLTPGIAVFGLSFISLFSATLISKDRTSSFMLRLFASPLTSFDFILGYTLPLLPMAIAQMAVCYIVALFLGLTITCNIIISLIVLIPCCILFIALGLLCGTLFNDKQVGGICGALLTNLTAWLSGTWIPLDDIGGAFKAIADALPFRHAVDAGRAALSGNYSDIMPDLLWVIAYATGAFIISVLIFTKKMKSDNK